MTEISYARADGKERKASVLPVGFSLEGLSDEQIQVIGHLSEASRGITPIFAQQNYERATELYAALRDLEQRSEGPEVRQALENYNTFFAACDSHWLGAEDVALRFPLQRSQVPEGHPLREFTELLRHGIYPSRGRGLYPVGITGREIDALGTELRENTSVVSDGNGCRVELNERRFRKELKPVLSGLQKAYEETSNTTLQDYLSAQINALITGSREARTQRDHAWLRLDSSIDALIDTAVEPALDQIRGVQGCAMSVVGRLNTDYQDLSDELIRLMPEWEQRAPWRHKKQVDESNAPQLRFMDVASFSGGYDLFPATVMAQTLPNDDQFVQTYGCVDLIFTNVLEAMNEGADKRFMMEEMLPREARRYEKDFGYMELLMTTTHEIGHQLGAYQEEGSVLDEAKAELFSMWSLPRLRERGVVSGEQEVAGYYRMLMSLLKDMTMEPVSHPGARNMMFHYFLDHGGVVEREEDGRTKYAVNTDRMRSAVTELLGLVGETPEAGEPDVERLKEHYIRDRKDEFEPRLQNIPEGRLLIFPTMEKENGRYTGELTYPDTYRGQPRTLGHFV